MDIVEKQITEEHLSDEIIIDFINTNVGSDHSLKSEKNNFTTGCKKRFTTIIYKIICEFLFQRQKKMLFTYNYHMRGKMNSL